MNRSITYVLKRVGFLALNLAIITFLWMIGWKAILGFCVGVFAGACIILWWAYTKNSFMSGLLSYMWEDLDIGNNKRKTKKQGKTSHHKR